MKTKDPRGNRSPKGNKPPRTGSLPRAVGKAMRILRGRPEPHELPVLTLSEYRALIAGFPRPTEEQVIEFCRFVPSAKSWYKHLPINPPGMPFFFYIDPWAGLDRILAARGRAIFVQRLESTPPEDRFHYTWMPTETYRARFGRLAFACEASTAMAIPATVSPGDGSGPVHEGVFDNSVASPIIYATADRPCRLPPEVLAAGCAWLTAVIHPRCSYLGTWHWRLRTPWTGPEELRTEREAAIAATVEAYPAIPALIDEFLAELQGDGMIERLERQMDALLAPERERMHQEMVRAIQRMLGIVY